MPKKDYCTAFPDVVLGVEIRGCCKEHDNNCGERGTLGFWKIQIAFFNCIKKKLGLAWACLIGLGGGFFCGLKYPYFMYKKRKYMKTNNYKRGV